MKSFQPPQPKRSLLSTPAAPTPRLLSPSRPLAPTSSLLPPARPLVSSSPPASEPVAPPIQGQLERAARLGHHFARIPLFPPASDDARTQGEPLQEKSEPTRNKENHTGLPDTLKTGMENLSGLSLDDVHVHYNSPQPTQLQALAHTQGTEIHVGPGQEKHLAHEAWHVVQQKQGRVKPTLQARGVAMNDEEELEREADILGEKAIHMASSAASLPRKGIHLPFLTKTDEARTVQSQRGSIAPRLGSPVQQRGGEKIAGNVIQRKTTLKIQGEDQVSNTDTVAEISHDRDSVHAAAATRAKTLGGWQTVAPGAVCNHSVSYDNILIALKNYLQGETVQEVAQRLHILYIQFAEQANKDTGSEAIINALGGVGAVRVKRDSLDQALNYFIYKICDYPGNLFYWPKKTNDELDLPVPITTKKEITKFLKQWDPSHPNTFDWSAGEENDRLKVGHGALEGSLGVGE